MWLFSICQLLSLNLQQISSSPFSTLLLPCITPGSLSRWLLNAFNQWKVLAGDWKLEGRRVEVYLFLFLSASVPSTAPAPTGFHLLRVPQFRGAKGWWPQLPPVAGLWVTPHSLLCPPNLACPSVSGRFMYFCSFEPSAMSSVSGRDSDINTIPVNCACSWGFPVTWKFRISTLTHVSVHMPSHRYPPRRVCINPLTIHTWALCYSIAGLHLFHGLKGWP